MDNNKIKMTDGEIAEIKLLQEKFQQKLVQLGQLNIQKIQTERAITDQENKLKDEWELLQKMEDELIQVLLKKYGEGQLDVVNGTFIQEKKATN